MTKREAYEPQTEWSKQRKRRFTFSASWQDMNRWKEFKGELGISLSAFIRTACEQYIEQSKEVNAE